MNSNGADLQDHGAAHARRLKERYQRYGYDGWSMGGWKAASRPALRLNPGTHEVDIGDVGDFMESAEAED